MTKRPAHLLSIGFAAVLGLLEARPLHALACAEAVAPWPEIENQEDSYAIGTRAMTDQRWRDAAQAFEQVIAARSNRSDAALYWKAYSLHHISRDTEAVASCDRLRMQFAGSTWNKDCAALFLTAHGSAGGSPNYGATYVAATATNASLSTGTDDDLKILALNSLMHQEPTRAIPLLRGILSGTQSQAVKGQAIFVLAQSKSPEAAALLHDAVLGRLSTPLQQQAIQMLSVFQGKRANDTLAEVYRTTADAQTKRAVISAFFVTHDPDRLVDLARSEKDLDLKRSIVSQLALMNDKVATDYMLELLR